MISKNLKLPDRVVMISPWLNLSCNTASHEIRKESDPVLTKDRLLEYAAYYAGRDRDDADPSKLSFSIFPPLLALVGSCEILFDDAKTFSERIRDVQPAATFSEYQDQIHVWPLTNIDSKESREALSEIKAFIA